jgi:hypothetical protein
MFDPDQRSILLDYLVFIGRRSWLTPQMGLEGSPEARQFMGCNVRPNTSPHQFFWSLSQYLLSSLALLQFALEVAKGLSQLLKGVLSRS